MPAIDSLFARFGFVKLSRYGLVLTPEGRIMSLRPAVLDDGLGGRIVGWADGDLAAMELQKWEPARPAPAPAVATRLAIPAVAVVAPAPQVEEDDWEWEIALARARVAAEESEKAASSVTRRARLDTIPPPTTPQLAVVTIPAKPAAIEPLPEWPKTEPITTITVVSEPAPKKTQPLAAVAIPSAAKPVAVSMPTPAPVRPGTVPPTVIPIPKLPSLKDRQSQIQPVVARTRLAKGTGPVTETQIGPAPAPSRVAPLPPAARAITLPRLPRL